MSALILLVARGVETLALWRDRARQRRILAALDERMLSDIGRLRAAAERESGKPFWSR